MIKFEVDISQIKQLAALVPRLEPIIADEAYSAMDESGMVTTTAVAAEIAVNSKNTGALEAAVSWPSGFTTKGTPKEIYEGTIAASGKASVFGTAPSVYSNYVEFGIAPTWVPIEPLEYWVIRKLGAPAEGARGIARLIQLAIHRRGIKAKYNFRNAWDRVAERKVKQIWDKLPAKVVRKWESLR